jgi:hypothetical protein
MLCALIGIVLLVGCGFAQPSFFPQSSGQANKRELNFRSETGGFAVWLPVKVEPNDEIRAGTCISATRDTHFFFARSNGAYWLVQYCKLSEDEMKKLSVSVILDRARHDALAEAFGTLKEETEITVNGYSGRHIVADSALKSGGMEKPDGTYKARVFLVRNRVYRVAAYVFNANWGGDLEKMDEFLRSFMLLRP